MSDRLRRAPRPEPRPERDEGLGTKTQSSRLTAEPETLEFLRQLLKIAQESDHPMDKALTRVLSKQIGETEAVRLSSPQAVQSSPQAEGDDNGRAG